MEEASTVRPTPPERSRPGLMSGAAAPAETIAGVCGMALEAAGRDVALEVDLCGGMALGGSGVGGSELPEAAETLGVGMALGGSGVSGSELKGAAETL